MPHHDMQSATRRQGSLDDALAMELDEQLSPNKVMMGAVGSPTDDLTPPVPAEEPTSFFSLANLRIVQASILGGTLNGYSIGFVGVYIFLHGTSTDCSLYHRETPCVTLSNAKCAWNAAGNYCGWATGVTCGQTHFTEGDCLADSSCVWSYSDATCRNPTGLSSSYSGVFAAALVVGCMIGGLGGPLIKRLGFKLTFTLIGLVALVMSVLYHVAVAVDEFWLLCAARLVIGVPIGLVCVAAPMFVGERAAPRYAKMLGMFFQIFTCFGIFLTSLIGVAVGQTIRYNAEADQHIMGRIQGLCAPSTVISVFMILFGLFIDGFGLRDKQTSDGAQYKEADSAAAVTANAGEAEAKPAQLEYTICEMVPRLLMGIVVAATVQLVGINAVMNFAPVIMSSFGLAPMVGNLVVMAWSFLSTLVSIPLASKLSMRVMFLLGTISTGCACLFMCGIPVYPGVTKNPEAKNGVAITGILLFVAGFQFFVGTSFYVVMFDLFPPSFAPRGASFTICVQFVFNIIVNAAYSSAVERFSGGPSGNQDKGQAIVFMFFGGVGVVCFILEWFFMHAWEEPIVDDKADGESGSPIAKGPDDEARVGDAHAPK